MCCSGATREKNTTLAATANADEDVMRVRVRMGERESKLTVCYNHVSLFVCLFVNSRRVSHLGGTVDFL